VKMVFILKIRMYSSTVFRYLLQLATDEIVAIGFLKTGYLVSVDSYMDLQVIFHFHILIWLLKESKLSPECVLLWPC